MLFGALPFCGGFVCPAAVSCSSDGDVNPGASRSSSARQVLRNNCGVHDDMSNGIAARAVRTIASRVRACAGVAIVLRGVSLLPVMAASRTSSKVFCFGSSFVRGA